MSIAAHAPQPAPLPKLGAQTTQKALLDGLKFVAAAIPSRPPMQVLLGVKITASKTGVTLSTFDYDVSCTEVVHGHGQGEVLVRGRFLLDIVKMLDPGPVKLRTNNGQLIVEQGDLSYEIDVLALEDYPALPDTGPNVLATVTGADLVQLNRAAVAVGRDATLPVLTAICLDSSSGKLVSAATDRYRLAVLTTAIKAKKMGRLLIPYSVLGLIVKSFASEEAITLSVTPGSPMIAATAGTRRITARLMEGEFPKYESLLPAEDAFTAEATVNVANTARAVKQVALVGTRNEPVRLASVKGQLTVHAGQVNGGKAAKKLAEQVVGTDLTIGFNPDYLLAGLASSGTASRIQFVGATRPAVLSNPDDNTFRYLLMPVRFAS